MNTVKDIDVRTFILDREKDRISKDDQPKCQECGGLMILFIWPIYLCIPCHERRCNKQARSGQELVKKLEITNLKEHHVENPF